MNEMLLKKWFNFELSSKELLMLWKPNNKLKYKALEVC